MNKVDLVAVITLFCSAVTFGAGLVFYYCVFKIKDIHNHHQQRVFLGCSTPVTEILSLVTMLTWGITGSFAFILMSYSLHMTLSLSVPDMPSRGATMFVLFAGIVALIAGLRDASAKQSEASWQWQSTVIQLAEHIDQGGKLDTLRTATKTPVV